MSTSNRKTRVIAYIDGFNFYNGLVDAGCHRFKWLNLQSLSLSLIRDWETLCTTKYFTSRTKKPEDKYRRQNVFLEALETLENFEIFYGHYLSKPRFCRRCNTRDWIAKEKMTDVNIATELLCDAYEDKYDSALLITGDSDLVAPVKKVITLGKRVVVAFPPNRFSFDLASACTHNMVIGRANLRKSMLPDEVRKPNGFVLKRPEGW